MNTTTTTAPAAPAVKGSRRVARILGILAVLFAGLFATVGQAAPASAAGSYSTGVYFCTNANQAVQLQVWNGSSWAAYKNGTSGSGCGTFRYVDAGRYYRVAKSVSYNSGWCGSSYTQVYATNYGMARAGSVISVGNWTYQGGYYWC